MDKRISRDIKKLRLGLGITQIQLADIVGTASQNIANYEAHRAMPPAAIYLKIMDLNAEYSDLIKMRAQLLKPCA